MGLPFPVHIIEVIFSKLPISNLPICRLVCRAWNNLFLNSKFLISKGFLVFTSHLHHYHGNPKMHCVDTDTLTSVASFEFDTDDFTFYHFCNGLFFMSKWNPTRCVGILNPLTNQFFKLPEFKSDDVQGFDEILSFGFGFSPKTNKYKLFRIIHERNTSDCRMEAFRFSTHNQWSLVPSSLPFGYYKLNGAYLNGFIYWILRKENAIDECVIYVLDVETEKIESTVVLKLGGFPKSMKIELFNDTIYVTVYIVNPCVIQVWKMQRKDSWVKCFVFDDEEFGYCTAGLLHLVKAFEDGRMLVLIKDAYFCLDKMGRKIKIQTFDLNARLVQFTCYLSSFNFGSLPNILTGHE